MPAPCDAECPRTRLPRTHLPRTRVRHGMPRSVVAILHVGYWALYLLLLTLFLVASRPSVPAPKLLLSTGIGLVLIAPNVVAFYVEYQLLAPRLFPTRRFGMLALLTGTTALATSIACLLILSAVSPRIMPVLRSPADTAAFIAWFSALALIHMTIALVMRGFISWYEDITIKEQLTRQSDAVQGALLRSRLDAHFLFNTLNNIDVLVLRDAPAASQYLNQLSGILRYVLYDARAEHVPLSAELDYCDRYIALQRLRIANPDMVSYTRAGTTDALTISPLVLIPFIENAFKHAAGQREDDAIDIALTVRDRVLTLVCSNSYPPARQQCIESTSGQELPEQAAGGLGQQLVQQRLNLSYPDAHTLITTDANQRYSVRLVLELA